MKKLFTLFALMACFMGVNAVEIVDFAVDYTEVGKSTIGWKADIIQDEWITADEDGLHLYNPEVTTNFYDYQLWIFSGADLEVDVNYTIKMVAKVSDGTASVRCRIGNWDGGIAGTVDVNSTDYQEYTFTGQATVANSGLLVQFGDYVGTVSFKSITITHEGKEARPVEWIEQLTNGNAESAWPAWALEETDGVNINWRGDRAAEICAWALTMGKNGDSGMRDGSELDGRARPFPADIEAEAGNESNHVFAVHVTQIDKIDDDASIQWSNQFWIQSPKPCKAGTSFKLKFRYKAEKPVSVGTQIHKENPSDYLHWEAIGNVDFTTEWQEFDKTITFSDAQGGGWSVAFNLTSSSTIENPQEPNIFYFDDLSWQVMKLDEGLFVASANTSAGIDYDFDNAAELVYDEGLNAYVATVGKVGDQESWINEVMISTVRGNDKAFKSSTLKPSGIIDGTEDNWLFYTEASNAKIQLPAAGVWRIAVAPEDKQVNFYLIEGEQLVVKEPVDIVTNTTEFVVNATERDWLGTDDNGNPREEEVGTGAAWDNQFWIAANRDLESNEVTVLKFKYKASMDARTSTQAHKMGDDGIPCTYLNWQAIGDVNFTEEWQEYSTEFTIPAGDNGMRSIVFNMSEIKAACDYYIKDVQWYIKDAELEAAGKTMENLIDETGTANFWIKVNCGDPEPASTGISTITADSKVSTVTYNIAGQRVSKTYKGIVVKNGSKYVVK